MRWNLQVRASAAAAPPSAAGPGPFHFQARAAAGRVPRAGSELGRLPGGRGRPPHALPAPSLAGPCGRRRLGPASGRRRAGGGGKWRRRPGGTKWRRDPWGWARAAADGARVPRESACLLPGLSAGLVWVGGGLGPPGGPGPGVGGVGSGGGGAPAHPRPSGSPSPLALASHLAVGARPTFSLKTASGGTWLGVREDPQRSPVVIDKIVPSKPHLVP